MFESLPLEIQLQIIEYCINLEDPLEHFRGKLFTEAVPVVCRLESFFTRTAQQHKEFSDRFNRFWTIVLSQYLGQDVYEKYKPFIQKHVQPRKLFSQLSKFRNEKMKEHSKPMVGTESTDNYSCYTLTLVGMTGTGRNTLIQRYANNCFLPDLRYDPPIEEYYEKQMQSSTKQCHLSINYLRDPSVEFGETQQHIINKAHGLMAVCSVNSRESLQELNFYLQYFVETLRTRTFPLVVCLTKTDLPHNEAQITSDHVKQVIQPFQLKNMEFFEVSAKNSFMVEEAFQALTERVVNYKDKHLDDMNHVMEEFVAQQTKQKKKCVIM